MQSSTPVGTVASNLHLLGRTARLDSFITFCVLSIAGLLLAWPSLRYPMSYDDLHLVRAFSTNEIITAFHGNWDPDGIETPGLRPFTLLFNHARYALFGENVVGHRVLLIILYASFLSLIARAAVHLEIKPGTALLSVLMSMLLKYNSYHYVWISDGIHLFQGILCAGVLLFTLAAVRTPGYVPPACAVVCLVGGVLTREDSAMAVPGIILLGFSAILIRGTPWRDTAEVRRLLGCACALIVTCIVWVVYRRYCLPGLQLPNRGPLGYLHHLAYAASPMGLTLFNGWSYWLLLGWTGILGALIIACLCVRGVNQFLLVASWVCAAGAASATGLFVERTNLLLFSTTFLAMGVGCLLADLAEKCAGCRIPIAAAILWTGVGSAYVSRVNAESFHPYSSTTLDRNAQFLFGKYAHATIPMDRRASVLQELASCNITSTADLAILPERVAAARKAGRFGPSGKPELFVPRLMGLSEP